MAETTPKTIAILNGSPRKGNTHQLIQQISAILTEMDYAIDYIHIPQFKIKSCLGCFQCIKKGQCVIQDDTFTIVDRLQKADGIIIASPIFVYTVSGLLKNFFDRTILMIHRPVLVGKPSLCVATVMGSPLKPMKEYMEKVTISWGTHPSGFIGRSSKNLSTEVQKKELSMFLTNLSAPTSQFKPSLNELIYFQVQQTLSTRILMLDRPYWVEKHWENSAFYYPCQISTQKRWFARWFGNTLKKKAKPANFE